MDGVSIAGIAVGIPTIASLLLAIQVGKWQGKIEQIIKTHETQFVAQNGKVEKLEERHIESIKEQRQFCVDQKTGCAKQFDHLTDRLNGIKDKGGR